MKVQRLYFLLFFLILGCASIGLEPAQTFSDKEAYALGQLAGIRDVAANAVRNGTLDREEGQDVLAVTDRCRDFIDTARAIYNAGDTAGANSKLAMATAILAELQKHYGGGA